MTCEVMAALPRSLHLPGMTERSGFPQLLRLWRKRRGQSQLELSLQAEISTRHLSFLETARSRPSREMVLRLAEALDVPLRERNILLETAGFASVYSEGDLDAPELETLRRMIDFVLEQHAPFPAVLLDRHWNLRGMNSAAPRLFARFASDASAAPWIDAPVNLLRVTLHPNGLRPFIVNFEEVATESMAGLQRRVVATGDEVLEALFEELTSLPGMPSRIRVPDLTRAPLPVLPIHLKNGDLELQLFTAITQVSSAQDVTVSELRIESMMPADGATDAAIRRMAAETPGPPGA